MTRTTAVQGGIVTTLITLLGTGAYWWWNRPKPPKPPPPPITHTIETATPPATALDIKARVGDTLDFRNICATCSIVEVDANGVALPWGDAAMTGPKRHGIPGIYVRAEVNGPVQPGTWEQDEISGVLLVIDWKRVERTPGEYDTAILDAALDAAWLSGKVVVPAFRAGIYGTPKWLFEAPVNAKPLSVQAWSDATPPPDAVGCGPAGIVFGPDDLIAETRWTNFLRAMGEHVRERGDRYQSVGAVKVSGLAHITDENQVARSQLPGCPNNPKMWAQEGLWTPDKVYRLYGEIGEALAEAWPTKGMEYMLIQSGLIGATSPTNWGPGDGNTTDDIKPVVLTETIIANGEAKHGILFESWHNGLRAGQPPNAWVRAAGARGFLTGFQTTNAKNPGGGSTVTWQDVEGAFLVALEQSDAVAVELYEGVWTSQRTLWGSATPIQSYVDAFAAVRDSFPDDPSPASWPIPLTTAKTILFKITGSPHTHKVTVAAK